MPEEKSKYFVVKQKAVPDYLPDRSSFIRKQRCGTVPSLR